MLDALKVMISQDKNAYLISWQYLLPLGIGLLILGVSACTYQYLNRGNGLIINVANNVPAQGPTIADVFNNAQGMIIQAQQAAAIQHYFAQKAANQAAEVKDNLAQPAVSCAQQAVVNAERALANTVSKHVRKGHSPEDAIVNAKEARTARLIVEDANRVAQSKRRKI